MKTLFPILIWMMSLPAVGQTADAIYRRSCGPQDTMFDIQRVKEQPSRPPVPGKAQVYFIQKEYGPKRFITRVGLDGAWVGAVKGDSYIAVSVAPGEHHACVDLQHPGLPKENNEFLHIAVEAGKVYYYLIRSIDTATGFGAGADVLEFGSADQDEARFLIASTPQSLAKPKR